MGKIETYFSLEKYKHKKISLKSVYINDVDEILYLYIKGHIKKIKSLSFER